MTRSSLHSASGYSYDYRRKTTEDSPWLTALNGFSPIHLWRTNEATGTQIFDSGSVMIDGVAGAGLSLNQPSIIPSDPDTCARFNGASNTPITLDSVPSIQTGITYVLAMQVFNTAVQQYLFNFCQTNLIDYTSLQLNGGVLQLRCEVGNTAYSIYDTGSSVPITNNQAFLVAFTFPATSTNRRMYVANLTTESGVVDVTNIASNSLSGSSGVAKIGQWSGGTNGPLNGFVKDMAILPSVLSLADIQTLYNAAI